MCTRVRHNKGNLHLLMILKLTWKFHLEIARLNFSRRKMPAFVSNLILSIPKPRKHMVAVKFLYI